jgi:superfamily II DNA or RNA helicase
MIKINVNSVKGKLFNCPIKIEKEIYKLCSYQVFNFQFSDAYLNGYWDGYVRKYSIKTHTFPSGLLYRLIIFLKKKGLKVEVNDTRKKLVWTEKQVLDNLEDFKFELRPYQIDGLIRGLNVPYLVFWWATSAGKTVQFSALISALKRKTFRRTLILVSNKDLAAQHRKEIGDMLDTKVGLIEEGRFEPERITVAVINTLWIRAVKNKNPIVLKYLDEIEHLISDETHHIIDSKMFKQTINKCVNTIARHGFSGTPFSLTTDDLELEAVTGPPLSKVPMTKLISEGWVSTPHIFMIKYDCEPIRWVNNYAELYSKKIVDNVERNIIITNIVSEEYLKGDTSILVTIRIIKHGKKLKDMFIDAGIDPDELAFIHGSTSKEQRKKVKELFKEKILKVVIASSIWTEGIDIPTVDVLMQADGGGGKDISEGRGIRSVIQKIGRVIRKPILAGETDVDQKRENIVRVYDFFDNSHKNLAKHSLNRFLTYKMEEGFVVKEVIYEAAKGQKNFI